MTTLASSILEIPEQTVGGILGSFTVPANKYVDYTLSGALTGEILSFPNPPNGGGSLSGPFPEDLQLTELQSCTYKARIPEGVTIEAESFAVGNLDEPGALSTGPLINVTAQQFNFIEYMAYIRVKLDGVSAFLCPVGRINSKSSYGASFPALPNDILSTPTFEITHTTEIYAVPKGNFPDGLKEGN